MQCVCFVAGRWQMGYFRPVPGPPQRHVLGLQRQRVQTAETGREGVRAPRWPQICSCQFCARSDGHKASTIISIYSLCIQYIFNKYSFYIQYIHFCCDSTYFGAQRENSIPFFVSVTTFVLSLEFFFPLVPIFVTSLVHPSLLFYLMYSNNFEEYKLLLHLLLHSFRYVSHLLRYYHLLRLSLCLSSEPAVSIIS